MLNNVKRFVYRNNTFRRIVKKIVKVGAMYLVQSTVVPCCLYPINLLRPV